MAPTQMRRVWLTSLIREVHAASRGTYGSRRVHAELTLGMGVHVSERLVAVLMSMNRIAGQHTQRQTEKNTPMANTRRSTQ
jgi:transposase InsO family protein